MERKEIAMEQKWCLEDIYPTDEAWNADYKKLEEMMNEPAAGYVGKLGEKQVLQAYFKEITEVSRLIEKLYMYAHMRHDEDVRVSKNTSNVSMLMSMFAKLSAKYSFVDPELTALPEETLQAYINDPDFAAQEYQLRRIAAGKAHVLSGEEEKILALASDALGGYRDVFMMLDNANLNLPKAKLGGEEVQMSHGLYGVALHSGTNEERKEWFEKYYQAYINLIDAIAQTYYGNVKKDVFYTTARKYSSCLEKALDGEDVQPIVYENLIESVHGAFPAMHEYISLRQELLGFEQHMYDIYAPLVEDAEIKLPFEAAYDLVIKGLAPLGEEYEALLKKAKEDRWIDVYENDGKRSGAYSSGSYDTHPYVLLNYQETTNDIFTIAHEMGHAIHTYQSTSAQPYEKSQYTIFLAEIASTVNEVLLLKHLYKETTDDKLKRYLLTYYMDMIRATLFRQTQFAEFEQQAHAKAENGEPLTKENLCALYYDLNKAYYGEGIVHDSQIAYEWARIPHFYTSFYVYKYATGIISAISIVRSILSEGEPAVKRYFKFLQSGGCTDPVTILQGAGIDLTTKAPFEAAMQEFKDTLAEFKKLTK